MHFTIVENRAQEKSLTCFLRTFMTGFVQFHHMASFFGFTEKGNN